jgi:hypothetical protein
MPLYIYLRRGARLVRGPNSLEGSETVLIYTRGLSQVPIGEDIGALVYMSPVLAFGTDLCVWPRRLLPTHNRDAHAA